MLPRNSECGERVMLAAEFMLASRRRRGGQEIGQPSDARGGRITALAVEQALEVRPVFVEWVGGHRIFISVASAAGVTLLT
jgi:hypothetical protein